MMTITIGPGDGVHLKLAHVQVANGVLSRWLCANCNQDIISATDFLMEEVCDHWEKAHGMKFIHRETCRVHDPPNRLTDAEYSLVTSLVPLACIDLIVEGEGGFLVCKRAIPPNLGGWSLPGGKINKGETLEEAVHRKAHEELGVSVAILRQLMTCDVMYPKYSCVTTAYLCKRVDTTPISLDFQHSAYKWVADPDSTMEHHVSKFINAAREFAHVPTV